MIKKTTVTKKWRTTRKDGKVVSENFNQKITKKSKKYATKKSGYPLTVTLQNTHVRIHKREAGVFCSIWYLRAMMGARSIRSDENVSEDHAREWLCHKVSSLVFCSVLGVFLSVFFCISLSFLRRARARCVSLSLLLSPRTTHQGGEEDFGDALDDDDEYKWLLNVCVDVQKDRPKDDLSPGQTRFFLYLLWTKLAWERKEKRERG